MCIFWSWQRFLLPSHKDRQMDEPFWESLIELRDELLLIIENL
jgi:hypothetical protein